jgi:hypothetical protein
VEVVLARLGRGERGRLERQHSSATDVNLRSKQSSASESAAK